MSIISPENIGEKAMTKDEMLLALRSGIADKFGKKSLLEPNKINKSYSRMSSSRSNRSSRAGTPRGKEGLNDSIMMQR
jgi:hypothetical protein